MNVKEFWCLWFESRQEWHVFFDDLRRLGPFPSIGTAVGCTLSFLERAESEFQCTEDTGEAYRYQADEEFYGKTSQ